MISNKYIFINDNDNYCCVCFETFHLIKRTKEYYTQNISNEFNKDDDQNTEIDLNELINKYINDFDREIFDNTNVDNMIQEIFDNTNVDNMIQEISDNTNVDNMIQEIFDNTIEENVDNMIEENVDNMIEEITDNMIEEIVNDIIEEKLDLDSYLSLSDIDKDIFDDNKIPNELLVKSCCNIHYICIRCIRKMINNYDNHPINENNSHIACPYPFKDCVTNIGFKNVFNHNLIRKVCNTEDEWNTYLEHSNRYAFPGYTIIKCPIYNYRTASNCNTDILVENIILKTANKGELILECSQNNSCLKKFCYCCKEVIYNYYPICYTCKTNYENENPNVYNYYFNKNSNVNLDENTNTNEITNDTDSENANSETSNSTIEEKKTYDESSYLFKNNEITREEAMKQMIMLLENINNYMICSICKNSLYKTEKCNALSHHNLERCYACGRIGFLVKGLGDHWNVAGVSGCYRFDHDSFIKNFVSEYKCSEYCSNHEKGDCTNNEHLNGIELLNKTRIKSCLFHAINSLLPELRFIVYDDLYNYLKKNKRGFIEFLPFKQTLILVSVYKERSRDYIEQIIYEQLKCEYPGNIEEFKLDKSVYIDAQLYLDKYLLNKNLRNDETSSNGSLIIYNNDNLNTETNIRIDTNIENANFTDNIFRSLINIDTDNFFVNINEIREQEQTNINEIMEQERISRRFYVPEISLYNNMERIDEINVDQNRINETTETTINEIIESDITDEIIVYNGRSIRHNN